MPDGVDSSLLGKRVEQRIDANAVVANALDAFEIGAFDLVSAQYASIRALRMAAVFGPTPES